MAGSPEVLHLMIMSGEQVVTIGRLKGNKMLLQGIPQRFPYQSRQKGRQPRRPVHGGLTQGP